jgi:hypothetical protein
VSDSRPIVYTETDPDGEWVIYRASSIGKPTRCLAAAREGAEALPAPQYLIDAAEAGNRYEGIVKERLRAEGWTIPESEEQDIAELVLRDPTPAAPGIKVRGHLDGWTAISPEDGVDTMLEVKSMSGRVFEEWVAHQFPRFPEYAAQLTCYMMATGKPATYAVVCRDDEDGEERLLTQRVETPPVEFSTLSQKTLIVEAFYDRGSLPTCDGTSKYQCPYAYLCDSDVLTGGVEGLFAELESGDEATMRRLIQQYAEAGRLIEELQTNQAALKADMEVTMGARKSVKLDGWLVTRVGEGTQKRLDAAALRNALGDRLDEFYKDTKRSGYISVTSPKKK